jgi:hypothetical protein
MRLHYEAIAAARGVSVSAAVRDVLADRLADLLPYGSVSTRGERDDEEI